MLLLQFIPFNHYLVCIFFLSSAPSINGNDGNSQWEAAEEAIHQIVTHSDDEFSLTYEDLKKMLDWKDRLEELSVKCSTLVRMN